MLEAERRSIAESRPRSRMRAGRECRIGAGSNAAQTEGREEMTVTHKIRVLTVDDHPILRSGIAAVIQGEEDILLVGEATNGQEAVEAYRGHRPDVTLMDLQMPVMNGIEAILEIRRGIPTAPFVRLTTYNDDFPALRAL